MIRQLGPSRDQRFTKKIADRLSAQERARALIQTSNDLELEVGRLVSVEIKNVQDILQEAMSKLAIISAAYSSGALPKKVERE